MAVKIVFTCPKCGDTQKTKLPDDVELRTNHLGNITLSTDCTWCGELIFIALQVTTHDVPF